MRKGYLGFVIAGAIVLLLVAMSVVVLLPRTHVDTGNGHLRLATVIVMSFLIITLIRYFILLWLGYLHHVEVKTTVERGDHFEPLVTVLVPAYNEETVIEASIRSLL